MRGNRIEELFIDGEAKDDWLGIVDPWRTVGECRGVGRWIYNDGGATFELEAALAASHESWRDKIKTAFDKGIPVCESPIERALLPWLIAQEYRCFAYNPAVLLPGEQDSYVPFTVAVVPQLTIGRYRCDFALAASRGGPIRFVVVECDGEKFHNGVEKVRQDVDRDVRLTSNCRVLDVIRLSGKEIMKNPQKAAARAAADFLYCWAKTNRSMKSKFGEA